MRKTDAFRAAFSLKRRLATKTATATTFITFRDFFFFQAEDGIRDVAVTGVLTCALPIFLRLEMVINEPEGFTVRKEVTRKGKKVIKWLDMLKGVAYLFRYKDVSLAANGRYLNALAQVDRKSVV